MLRFSIEMNKKPKNVKKNCVNLLAGSAIVFTTRFVHSPVHYVHAQTARLHVHNLMAWNLIPAKKNQPLYSGSTTFKHAS